MKFRSAKIVLISLMVLALAAPGLVWADDDDDDELVPVLCAHLDGIDDDTDRSNICPLTQGQYPED